MKKYSQAIGVRKCCVYQKLLRCFIERHPGRKSRPVGLPQRGIRANAKKAGSLDRTCFG